MRIFVVWEPVQFIDFFAPSTATLSRVSDHRASQYWDKDRLVSHLLGETDNSNIVWDNIAVFAPGTLWKESLPASIYSGAPVTRVMTEARAAIAALITAGGQTSR